LKHTAALGFAIAFFVATTVAAKRAKPAEVKPLVHEGVSYRAGHSADDKGNGGTVEAVDVHTGKRLWMVTVYEVPYDDRETDVQDVWITTLAIEKRCLVVTNERQARFCVDLNTHTVKKL